MKGATAKVTLGGARQCQTQPWSAQRAFPGPLWGPSSSPGSLCARRQDNLLVPAQATCFTPPSASRLQNREHEPGNVHFSRFPHRESAPILLKSLIPRPGLTAGWLPFSSVSALAEHEPTVQGADTQGPALAPKVGPSLPGSSTFLATNPQPRPGILPKTLQPEDPKLSPKQIYANERLQDRPAHLLSRSPPADLASIPAGSPASDPWGWGLGEGAKLSPRFHFKRMRIDP